VEGEEGGLKAIAKKQQLAGSRAGFGVGGHAGFELSTEVVGSHGGQVVSDFHGKVRFFQRQ
jgi:hypothetical protein